MQPEITYQHINKYLPFALLFMFFNAAGLPEGLLYTVLLTPFFLYYSITHNYIKPFVWFLAIGLFLFIIQYINGISVPVYLKSLTLAFCQFTFCVSVWIFLKNVVQLKRIYDLLTYTNLLLVVVALMAMVVPVLKNTFWYTVPFTPGVSAFPRLKLFWSEASVYSLYITPLVIFYILSLVRKSSKYTVFFLAILISSILLSLSLGVIVSILVSLFFVALFHFSFFFSNRRFNIGLGVVFFLGIAFLFISYKLYPEMALFKRVANIFSGNDTSARGRTYEAFILAFKIIQTKSYAFGIGLGQLKLIGRPIILSYYQYTNIPDVVRIPNACSETLISFGLFGFMARLSLEIYLFFKTKVFSNSYRLALFVFIFIYQFTGSYITNIAEYAIWIIAFSSSFAEFNKPILKTA